MRCRRATRRATEALPASLEQTDVTVQPREAMGVLARQAFTWWDLQPPTIHEQVDELRRVGRKQTGLRMATKATRRARYAGCEQHTHTPVPASRRSHTCQVPTLPQGSSLRVWSTMCQRPDGRQTRSQDQALPAALPSLHMQCAAACPPFCSPGQQLPPTWRRSSTHGHGTGEKKQGLPAACLLLRANIICLAKPAQHSTAQHSTAQHSTAG